MTHHYLIATVVMGLATAAASQQIYKWVDDKGVTQYATTPPPGGKAQAMKTQPATSGPSPTTKSWQDQEIEFRARQVERAEAQRKQEHMDSLAAQRRIACASAHRDLGILQEQRRIYALNEKGEPQYLDDAQRAEAARKARAIAEQECPK
jgi:hypothetical protein